MLGSSAKLSRSFFSLPFYHFNSFTFFLAFYSPGTCFFEWSKTRTKERVCFLIRSVSRGSQSTEILYGNQRRVFRIVLQSIRATMTSQMHFWFNIVVGTFYTTDTRWSMSNAWGWRDGLGDKSTCCSHKGSGFGSLSALMVAYNHWWIQFQRIWCSPSGLCRDQSCNWYTYMHTGKHT